MQAKDHPVIRGFQSRNPMTNELVAEFPYISTEELLRKIERSWEGFQAYQFSTPLQRKEKLGRLAAYIHTNVEKFATLITQEMGKPIKDSTMEAQGCAGICQFYSENAEKFLEPKVVVTDAKKSMIEYRPMGPILFITPFNFPFVLVIAAIVPALLAGNSILFRPADSTPRLGKAIEEALLNAGFDHGEAQLLFSTQDHTETLLAHRYIRGISFTGSTRAGNIIASIAGRYGKKAVMELGGSDPFIVLEDADIEKAATLAVAGRLANCGQVCHASKRFIVHENVYEQFKVKLLEHLPTFKMGDPSNPETGLGPMARPDLREAIEKQLEKAVGEGAKLIYGGKRPTETEFQAGNFYIPAVCEVEKDNLLFREETFGPIFAITKVSREDEMVKIANNTEYGLSAVVVSKDTDRAERLGQMIDAGSVYVNSVTRPYLTLPFGGVKGSGFGRQLTGDAVHEFANIKTVVIHPSL